MRTKRTRWRGRTRYARVLVFLAAVAALIPCSRHVLRAQTEIVARHLLQKLKDDKFSLTYPSNLRHQIIIQVRSTNVTSSDPVEKFLF